MDVGVVTFARGSRWTLSRTRSNIFTQTLSE
jgi:hypothetical protein